MKQLLRYGFVLVAMMISLVAVAQDRTISGKVTSAEDGSGLPGVNIVVKGTTNGTATDTDGTYKIQVPAGAQVLIFSFVGFINQEITIGNRTTIDVALASDQKLLSEVVVVGYGEQSRKTLTSSVSSVSGATLANLATPSFDQQLAGRAAGVQITTPSGIVGQAPVIRIRGTNSVSSGASPLVVVDGIPMITGSQSAVTPTNPLGDINPSDIESIDVLKDGAATAIYGSRAANGVILITTKKGKKNSGAKVTFDTYFGTTNTIKRFDMLNASEFITISNEKFTNLARFTNPTAPEQIVARPGGVDTDWQSAIFRTGTIQNYALSFSGGVEKTSYFASVGYNEITSPIIANGQKRLNFRGNIDHTFNKWIEGGASLAFTRTTNTGLNTGTNSLSGNVAGALRMAPNTPVYSQRDPTGYNLDSLNSAVVGRWGNTIPVDNNYTNPAFVLDNNRYSASTNRVISNVYFKLNIPSIEGLSIKTQYSIDYLSLQDFQSLDPRHGDGRGSNGSVFQRARDVYRWNWQNTLSYVKSFGDHNINVVGGLEYQLTTTSRFSGGGNSFSDLFFLQNGLISGAYATQTSDGFYGQSGFDSYFGRLNYNYKGKYLLGVSARNDAISDLPIDNRRGTFLGGSLGYRVSDEEFYQNSGLAKIMNEVKLRGSIGQVGNVDIGSFPYAGLFGSAQYASQNGISYGQAGNPNLKWETSTKTDIGVELGFFSNRINVNIDYFNNNVDGLILDAPTASSLGVPNNSISKNVGSLSNKGWEFQIDADAIRSASGFKWNVNLNLSFIQNQITGLNKGLDGKDQDIFAGNFANNNYTIIRVGESIGSLYGYQSAGVNPANGYPMFTKGDGQTVQRNPNTGTYGFYTEGSQGFVADTKATLNALDVAQGGDRRVLGSTVPKWYGGFINKFSYKGFDLELFLRFSGGNSIMNVTRQTSLLGQDFMNNGREILDRWQKPGDVTDVPIVVARRGNIINLDGNVTSRFVEKGDFLRMQNIVIGYTLPQNILAKTEGKSFPIRSLRVYAQVQNAFTFTKYKGADPEINAGTGNANGGVDFNTSPQIRTFTFGLNVGL